MRFRRLILIPIFTLSFSPAANADLFGGDIAVLMQILVQAMQTVMQLKSILETGHDALDLLRDVNSGISSGLDLIHIINPKFDPGVYGALNSTDAVLKAIQDVYGPVPDG